MKDKVRKRIARTLFAMVSIIRPQGLAGVACSCILFGFPPKVSCQADGNAGLVAYYSFDGTTADSKGSNKDLQGYGAKPAPDRFGEPDRAYSFDGASAYMRGEISGMPDLSRPHSVIWWFQVAAEPEFKDSLDAGNMIVLADPVKNLGVQFGYRAEGYKTSGFDSWYWGGRTVLDSAPPENSKWHLCAYTYDGERHLLFIDGLQVAETNVKPQPGIPTMLMLGNYPGGDQFYAGVLDELRIYSASIPPSEIMALYRQEKAP